MDQALPVIVYKFQCLKADIPPQRVGGKAEIVQKLLPELGKVRSQVEVQEYVQMLARELELAENVIMAEYSRYRRKMQKNGMHRDKSPEIRNNTKVNAILYTPHIPELSIMLSAFYYRTGPSGIDENRLARKSSLILFAEDLSAGREMVTEGSLSSR